MRQNFRVVEGPILGWKQELRKNVTEERFNNARGNFKFSEGPARESKRKLTSQKPTTEAHMANVRLNAGSSENSQAQASLVKSQKNHKVGNDKEWIEAELFSSKLDHRASVKGKKAIARVRVHKETFQSTASSCQVL